MKFIIQAGSEALESNGGLVLAGKILTGLDLDRRMNGIVIDGALEPKAYEDIELYRTNGFFRRALGIKRVPARFGELTLE